MKFKLSFSILPIIFATMTVADDYDCHHNTITSAIVTNTPIQCVIGELSVCPSGSICTQTTTCGGLCQSIYLSPPPLQISTCIEGPINVARNCSTGSTCSTTASCFDEGFRACGGLCIATCTPGVPSNCPSGSSCAPITTCTSGSTCGGQCIYTQPSPSVPCILDGPSVCGVNSVCDMTETCSGQCIGTFVPTPTPTPTYSTRHSRPTSSWHHHKGDQN
jgi:hypothetical protein